MMEGRGRGREERDSSSRLPTAEQGALHRALSQDPESMTWIEIKSWPHNQLSHPGARPQFFSNK